MDKLLKAIQGMVEVEEAAESCHDCCIGAFCSKHDGEFWDFWREVKRYLTRHSSGRAGPCGDGEHGEDYYRDEDGSISFR